MSAVAQGKPASAGEGPEADPGRTIPQILLEEDSTAAPPLTGPGQKYALGPTALEGAIRHEEATLPDAYGTGKLFLTARDPQWLYAQWDFTLAQQRRYNALSADRHLLVRVYPGTTQAQPIREVHVHPESRHWFIHVGRADTPYVAELGYYRPGRRWVAIATSPLAVTPVDRPSAEQTVQFATSSVHARLAELVALAKATISPDLPPPAAALEHALAEWTCQQLLQQDWATSAEIAELMRGPEEAVSSPMAAPEERPTGFWLNVNAELILYGATEPDACVTLGGQPIQLRPDGTFSCRLALPDGTHAVKVSAMSAQGELRQAELEFSRRTDCRGETGTAPQDPSLQPPGGECP